MIWKWAGWARMIQAKGLSWKPRGILGEIMSFLPCLEKRGVGGQGSQGPGWPSLLQQEGFLRPPSLSSIPDTASDMNVRRHGFPFHGAICPGAKEGLSSLNLTDCSGQRGTALWLSCLMCLRLSSTACVPRLLLFT